MTTQPHARTRAVWHAVSERPQATVRELATETGIPFGMVYYHLSKLVRLGYVERGPFRARRARVIRVAFVDLRQGEKA